MEGKVTFLEGPHVYLNEKNQRYLSVTQLIDKFKNKFDPHTQALISINNPNSKYFGMKYEDVRAQWDKAGEDARTRGTAFHKGKEDNHVKQAMEIKAGTTGFVPNPARIIPEEDSNVMTDYTELPSGTYSELILWSHRWKLAGIADKIIIDGDYFDVEDYKTNKEIKTTSYYKKGEGYQMMHFPLNDIMDCSFEHYQLQLSIYAYMFAELSGKKPRKLTILHHPTVNGVITEEGKSYPLTYKKSTIIMMLNMWGGYAPPDYVPSPN